MIQFCTSKFHFMLQSLLSGGISLFAILLGAFHSGYVWPTTSVSCDTMKTFQ